MNLLQNTKRVILTFDLFCSSQLLRYHQDTQYKTFTGGILSLGIIVVIILGFFSMISDTLNKISITSQLTNIKQSNPPIYTLIPDTEHNFMFGISVNSMDLTYRVNLSATPKIFDVQMIVTQYVYGSLTKMNSLPLEMCTKQHWAMVPEYYQMFDSVGGSIQICLPIGYPLTIGGTFFSSFYSSAYITVSTCQNKTINDTCAPQAQIDTIFNAIGNFQIAIDYINVVINPSNPNPLSYYIQSGDFNLFSKTIGAQSWLAFSEFTINTDQSILPFSDIKKQGGTIVQNRVQNIPYTITSASNVLAAIFIGKSSNSLVYDRQVQKISAVFSYIGGLVGAVTALLFMIKSYTDSSLEITVGIDLFEKKNRQKNNLEFNLFGFFRLTAYRFLKLFKWNGEWEIPQKFENYQREAIKQLDISILLKRLIMLQSCISKLIPIGQIQEMRQNYSQRVSVRTAERMRSNFVKDQNKKETIQVEQCKNNQLDSGSGVNFVKDQFRQSSWLDMLGKNTQSKNIPLFRQQEMPPKKEDKERQGNTNEIVTKIGNDLFKITLDKQAYLHEQIQENSKKIERTKQHK